MGSNNKKIISMVLFIVGLIILLGALIIGAIRLATQNEFLRYVDFPLVSIGFLILLVSNILKLTIKKDK